MSATRASAASQLRVALPFLLPNLIGVLTFVVFPVGFAIVLAFTNWDLKRHNMFHAEQPEFVGLTNFVRLFTEADFLKFLGNTLFLMIAIPFSIGGSLLAAILLSKDTRVGGGRTYAWLLASAGLVAGAGLLAAVGLGASAMVVLLTGLAAAVLIGGALGGTSVYRTLFYLPHFTAGAATFVLWKKLYNPYTGPINRALQPVLDGAADVAVTASPLFVTLGFALAGVIVLAAAWVLRRLRLSWQDGDFGTGATLLGVGLIAVPAVIGAFWNAGASIGWLVATGIIAAVIWQGVVATRAGRIIKPASNGEGLGTSLMLSAAVMTGMLALLGLAVLTANLPTMAADGLEAPLWLGSYGWAKPSMMLIGLWAAIGSNNMLIYLAGLSGVPGDLYEAADLDGAGRFGKFWHVTWPQLAPTTFFIAVMATIHGLQGGFEMARVLTEGGPAGATTTLSYFIYTEGFETGRLSFSAATAWVLFLLVLGLTLFNWKFGEKYVNN